MADSTNVERQGYTPSEKNVGKRLDSLFAEHLKGRMIIATFASNVDRVDVYKRQIIWKKKDMK